MPVRPDDLPEWKDADRIGERIVALLNEELKRPDFSPTQMFVGQMLAMEAVLRTAPVENMPGELMIVKSAIRLCLYAMTHEPKKSPN